MQIKFCILKTNLETMSLLTALKMTIKVREAVRQICQMWVSVR